MSKWKCEICEKEFDNFHAQGFDNKIYCPLCFFKEKTNRLEKENQKYKELIDKLKEYMITLCDEYADDNYDIKYEVFNKIYYEILGDSNE